LAGNSTVTASALELLDGLMHPDCQKRFSYSKILQHAFFDAIRVPVPAAPPPGPTPPVQPVWTSQISATSYKQLLLTVSGTAATLEMGVQAQLFMLALIRFMLVQETANDQLLGPSCLFVADALYSNDPTTLAELAELSGLSEVDSLEIDVHRVLASTGDFNHPVLESLFSDWQIEASHQQYPELLHCYCVLARSGLHWTYTAAEIGRMCVLIVQPKL
jgi:hypothetical protein